MPNISPQTQKLILQYQEWQQSLKKKKDSATIHADEVASKVAAFYEKIRGVIDWREEHLLRRGAIERILKRRLFLRAGQKIEAAPFVLELIRAGHFPNDEIEETKNEEIQRALDKYVYIVEKSPSPKREKSRLALQDWLCSIAACEVEEILDPPRKERILINYMTELMNERIVLKNNLSPEEKLIQTHIAVQRALFKLDQSMIVYHLLKHKFNQWRGAEIANGLLEITQNIYSIWEDVEKQTHHPLSPKFYQICERYDTPYLILGDILSKDPLTAREKLNNPEIIENEINTFYQARLNQQKSRVRRAAFFSTLSIFLTKIAIALAIELPIDRYFGNFSLQNLGLNIVIPPILMLILILSIRPPAKANLGKVVIETMKIIFEGKERDTYSIRANSRQNSLMRGILFILNAATFLGVFWLVWEILGIRQIDFSWPSRVIFIIFLSMILFAGTKIKERAQEMSVERSSGGFLGFIIDWISFPFVQLGRWLSGQWARYNFIVVLIITLIDLPFQIFVEFLEQWRSFIKEKKEEIR
jgi:hypothetical protein